ncbi:hypothetical protein EV361DRAFT_908392 [Lentinula raphanica]|nr:hypothetical protein EV361DRAFT_908392 [Lentinula raphanica]
MVGHLWFFITSAVGSVLRSFVIQTASARFLARSKPRLLRTLAYNGYVYSNNSVVSCPDRISTLKNSLATDRWNIRSFTIYLLEDDS